MRRSVSDVRGAVLLGLVLLAAAPPRPAGGGAAPAPPGLVPWPRSVRLAGGKLRLSARSRIVAADASLAPLAEVLADEVRLVTGVGMATAAGRPRRGDIGLVLDRALAGEAHRLEVTTRATVRGGNYGAVALGTATLLQALAADGGGASLPRMSVADEPATEYRGLLIDVARKYHSIEGLKQIVQLCRLYKVRYLQLHLTDDQSFMFPSKAYPKLATQNQHGGKTYTVEELEDLVAYADARNVTIIPEYEVPGHSAAANRAMPELFVIRGTKPYEHHASINFAKDEVMEAVATIVGEMCEVFRSTPYFHIGGDEADLALAGQNADFQAAFRRHGLANQHQLYRKLLVDMNEIVKRNGKRMIVWEGFGRERGSPVGIPNDIIVMEYEVRFYMPDALVKDGYDVVNASWTPLYVVGSGRPPAEIYSWHIRQFKPYGAKPTDEGVVVPEGGEVFGAQMCAWEQPEELELPNERHRLPAMMERIWNPEAGRTYEDFDRRLAACDRVLDLLVHGFAVRADGLAAHGESVFGGDLTLSAALSPTLAGTVHYTLDGKAPSPGSPALRGPLEITDTADIKATAFGPDGKLLGCTRWVRYAFRPVKGRARGLLPDGRYSDPIAVTLESGVPGEIRYTLDGKPPTAGSDLYAEPIRLKKRSVTVTAGLFADGEMRGEAWSQRFDYVDYEKNLTTGRPVRASSNEAHYVPENAVDGMVLLEKAWWAGPAPQWITVDLDGVRRLSRVHVFPYWDGRRSYRYTVEVSTDGETWTRVVDMSRNTKASTPEGDAHEFAPRDARYVRVNMLGNTANRSVHIVEIRAYP